MILSKDLAGYGPEESMKNYPSPSMLRYLFVLEDFVRVSCNHQTCTQELACGTEIRVLMLDNRG